MIKHPTHQNKLITRQEIVNLSFARLFFIEEFNIVEVEYQAHSTIDTEEALAIVAAIHQFNKGEKRYFLINATQEFINLTADARSTYAREQTKQQYAIKMAIFVNSLAYRIIGNFFIRYDRPPAPARIFNSRKKAIEWLME